MYKDNQRWSSASKKKKEAAAAAAAAAWESSVRRSQQQVGRRRIKPMSDDSDPTSADDPSQPLRLTHAEKLLPNGDFYTGQWHRHLPHGVGKYLWTDGCMYEGDWRHGKTMGRGKFSWPSGAAYEGDFKSGFMDGNGTYIGINGDTYRGGWSMNLKHGSGKKSYANGDCYDGEWRSGMQDGHGRYIWKNGNEYNGQWRSGVIHGRGSLIWANGNRYDGGWEDGVPMGNGSFRWGDGSLYIGIWSHGGGRNGEEEEEKKGIYYPSPAATSPTVRDPQAIFDKELPECKICAGEAVGVMPSQKRLSWSGVGPDAPRPRRRGSVDNSAGGGSRGGGKRGNGGGRANTIMDGANNIDRMCVWDSEGDGDLGDGGSVMSGGRSSTDSMGRGEEEPRLSRSSQGTPIRLPRTTKKQGETIAKGHKNYELMLNLQLGIRYVCMYPLLLLLCWDCTCFCVFRIIECRMHEQHRDVWDVFLLKFSLKIGVSIEELFLILGDKSLYRHSNVRYVTGE